MLRLSPYEGLIGKRLYYEQKHKDRDIDWQKTQNLFFIGHEKWESFKILFVINFMVFESSTECFQASFKSQNCLGLFGLVTTTKLQHQFLRDNFFFFKTLDKGP